FGRQATLRALVADSHGIKVGAPVRFNGVDTGNIIRIAIDSSNGKVSLTFTVNNDIRPLLRRDAAVHRGVAAQERANVVVDGEGERHFAVAAVDGDADDVARIHPVEADGRPDLDAVTVRHQGAEGRLPPEEPHALVEVQDGDQDPGHGGEDDQADLELQPTHVRAGPHA